MSDILSRIENLRVKMEQNGLKAWLIPGTDPHMSEYLPKAWAERAYISGFTGSMGFIVIMLDKAGLWTDSRYFLQGETQLKGTGITLFKKGVKGTPEPLEWVKEQLSTGDSVGINGLLFSANDVMQMQDVFMGKTIALKTEVDLLSHLRDDASEEIKPAILLDGIYSGESTSSKLTRLRSAYSGNWMAIYSSLDQIAWLYNIRGTDVTYNPVLISYAIVTANAAYLFVDENKITENVKAELNKSGVEIKAYNSLFEFIENQTGDVCYIADASSINYAVYNAITQNNTIINTPSLVNTFKSIKNKTELDGFKKSMISDGVAMTRFLMWFEKAMDKGVDINEYEIGVQLKHFRSQQEGFMDESFCTIASFNENGAIVHYSPPAEGSAQILKNGILLFDSGGQYLYGTTDITRTISTGKVPQEAKDDFTHVLQGHIGLATAVFPEGTRGVQLDVLARNKMWKAGLDYGHGTGHGVGHFLNVHEGPQTIRKEGNNIPLEPGMVMTIEPGIYRLNCWGLRVENMVYIDKEMDSEFGSFLSFKNLTLFPIDLKLINMNLLSVDEIEWLNAYHSEVLQALSPFLEENEINWLKEKTRSI